MWSRAACVAVLFLSAGCGEGGEVTERDTGRPAAGRTPGTPAGFTAQQAGPVRLAHPVAWKSVKPPEGWAYVALLGGSEAAARARVGVITDVPQAPSARMVSAAAITVVEVRTPGVRRGPDRRIRVAGAAEAVRVDYTYRDVVDGEPVGDPIRATDVAVVTPARKAFVVRVNGWEDDLPPAVIDQIVASLAATV